MAVQELKHGSNPIFKRIISIAILGTQRPWHYMIAFQSPRSNESSISILIFMFTYLTRVVVAPKYIRSHTIPIKFMIVPTFEFRAHFFEQYFL